MPDVTLDIDLLRTFTTVYRTGSFSQAGQVLGRSQPAVSLQVKRLEDRLGAKVFERDGRPLGLTGTGYMLLDYAQQILRLHDEAMARLNVPDLHGHIRLGILEELGANAVPIMLSNFTRVFPNASLDLHVRLSADLLSDLVQDRLDLAFATGNADADDAIPVWREPLAWVCGSKTPPSRREPIPLVLLPEPSHYREIAIHALHAAGTSCHVACTSSTLMGVRASTIAGIGITAIGRSEIGGGLRPLPPDWAMPALPDVQVMLYRGRDHLAEVAKHLAMHTRNAL